MKTIKFTLFFLMILVSFQTLSQDIENIYYDKFILVDKSTNEIIEVSEIQTTISFNLNTKIMTITSPILVERFAVNDALEDVGYIYLYTTCIDHNIDIIMIANEDGNRFILYDYDENYYYVFETDY